MPTETKTKATRKKIKKFARKGTPSTNKEILLKKPRKIKIQFRQCENYANLICDQNDAKIPTMKLIEFCFYLFVIWGSYGGFLYNLGVFCTGV